MLLLKKIKASALQMVLVVSVIIVILLFAFISLIFLQKRMNLKNANYNQSVYANHQVFKYLKSNEIPFGKTDSIAALSTQNSIATVVKKQWGIFEMVHVTSKVNRETFQQSALLGMTNPQREALYLRNNNQPLIVVGNTLIKGNVTIPMRGVNSGNISGVSYNREEFIYGEIAQSETKIPTITNRKNIDDFLSSYANDSVVFFEPKIGELQRNSFAQKTLVHQRNGIVDLVDIQLIGNIIIESDQLIHVHASSNLEDVILIAPKIEIASGFKGNIQAFATKNIQVKEKSELAYPSALVLFNSEDNSKDNKQIHVATASVVKGVIGYFSDKKSANYKPQILLENDSKIDGEVYCFGNLELRGRINGSVYTNSFVAIQKGSTYMNHIYNGIINSETLPEQYAGLLFRNSQKGVAKWVH